MIYVKEEIYKKKEENKDAKECEKIKTKILLLFNIHMLCNVRNQVVPYCTHILYKMLIVQYSLTIRTVQFICILLFFHLFFYSFLFFVVFLFFGLVLFVSFLILLFFLSSSVPSCLK